MPADLKTKFLRKVILSLPTRQFKSLYLITQNVNGFGYTTFDLEVTYFTDLFIKSFSETMFVADIGANKGQWTTQLMTKVAEKSSKSPPNFSKQSIRPVLNQCVLLEPSKHMCIELKNKFKFSSEMVILNKAVSNYNGFGHLCSANKGDLGATLKIREIQNHKNCEDVEVLHINDLLKIYPSTNCIKLDTEGSEFDILSSINLLKTRLKVIQFEFGNPPFINDSNKFFLDFFSLFSSCNWKLFRISPKFLIPISTYSTDLENRMVSNYLALNDN